VLSADLGLPDIGLTTLTEVAGRGQQIARMTELPAIIDADTGFGEPMNVARTIQTLEDAGLAGTHIEDQVNPKRCGHLDGKAVVDESTATQRIRAAVDAGGIRTSSSWRAPTSAPWRAWTPRSTGPRRSSTRGRRDLPRGDAHARRVRADGLRARRADPGEHDRVRQERAVHAAAADAGVSIVIWPVSMLRIAMGATGRALDTLNDEGHLTSKLGEMQHRADLYDLIDYESYNHFDTNVFNFRSTRSRSLSRLGDRARRSDMSDPTSEGPRGRRRRHDGDLEGQPRDQQLLYRGYPVQELAATSRSRRSPTCSGTASCPRPSSSPRSRRRRGRSVRWIRAPSPCST
jgi:methylisocitrate lyase